jgi:hypothetical protein
MASDAMSEKRDRSKGDFFLARLERSFEESRRWSLKHAEKPTSVGDKKIGQQNFRPSDLRLDPGDPEDWLILRAFEVAALDRNDPGDFKEFARRVSAALFAKKHPKWSDERNDELLSDYDRALSDYNREYPDLPKLKPKKICERLLNRSPYNSKYKGESAEYLLKRVRAARDPKNNIYLSIRKRREFTNQFGFGLMNAYGNLYKDMVAFYRPKTAPK